jgi:hypothetical protein
VAIRRIVRIVRVEAVLALAAYACLLALAHPARVAGSLDLESVRTERIFELGLVGALAALGCLMVRLAGRAIAAGQHAWGKERATAGTVIAEFALVLPLVLLVMSMIVQLALIANAALVVRYATFSAARSAIVNLDSRFKSFQPAPEWVDKTEPERAAHLVLAAISPRSGARDAVGSQLETVLQDQPDSVWVGRDYADRLSYAKAAARVTTRRERVQDDLLALRESYSRLLPASEHVIPPHLLAVGGQMRGLPIIAGSTISGKLVPSSFKIPITLPPLKIKVGKFPAVKIPLQPPFPKEIEVPIPSSVTTPLRQRIDAAIQPALNVVSSGSAAQLDARHDSPWNVDFFSPKRVEITVEYDFLLTLPSLHFVPGLGLADAPGGSGKAFTLTHTVELQSTGGRRANVSYVFLLSSKFRDALKLIGMESGWFLYW